MDRPAETISTLIGLAFGILLLLSMGVVMAAAIYIVAVLAVSLYQYRRYRVQAVREFERLAGQVGNDLPADDLKIIFFPPTDASGKEAEDDGRCT